MPGLVQDKQQEINLFDGYAVADGYDVFAPESSMRLIQNCIQLLRLRPGSRVGDIGCGSGVFTHLLQQMGYDAVGVDISPKLIEFGKAKYPNVDFLEGDVEHLPFPDCSLDGVLLGGLVHHLPNPTLCATEVFRVLKPGGSFVAFDPNRMNPFMFLYRDRASPFYSSIGVTRNERPVLAHQIAQVFMRSGFKVGTAYISNIGFRFSASPKLRWLLPVYNTIDRLIFGLNFLKPLRSFILTYGEKP